MNNSTYYSPCLEFSRKVATDIFITKTTLWSIRLSILLSYIVSMFVSCGRLGYDFLFYQLLGFLMVFSAGQGIFQILGQLSIEVTEDEQLTLKNGSGWHNSCLAFAYLDMVATWTSSYILSWIMLLMLRYYYRLITGHSLPRKDRLHDSWCQLIIFQLS